MVGHIEQFNPVILKINEIKKDFGRVISTTFKRVGFYPTQIDENIIIDFQIHDINNSLFLFGLPNSVISSNIKGKNDKFDDSISILKYNDKNVILQTS
jgi:predicted dehydrogenase